MPTKKKRRVRTRQLVVIEWGDAWVHGPWDDHESSKAKAKPVIVYTVGWMIKKDAKGVLVAAQIAGDTQFANQSFIPRGMIRSVTVLKRGALEHE